MKETGYLMLKNLVILRIWGVTCLRLDFVRTRALVFLILALCNI